VSKHPLKPKNAPMIALFIIYCFSLYLLFISGFEDFLGSLFELISSLRNREAFVVVVTPLLSFILPSLFSSDIKAIITFWKLKNPLPGTRAFTVIAPSDVRVDLGVLKTKFSSLPTEPKKQNQLWYKIYKQVQESPSVILSHKYFLLARDLSTIAFLFLVTTPWALYLVTKDCNSTLFYLLITSLQYVALSIVTQNCGNSFVGNVLAEYCYKNSIEI
jgi:hypothetical protein